MRHQLLCILSCLSLLLIWAMTSPLECFLLAVSNHIIFFHTVTQIFILFCKIHILLALTVSWKIIIKAFTWPENGFPSLTHSCSPGLVCLLVFSPIYAELVLLFIKPCYLSLCVFSGVYIKWLFQRGQLEGDYPDSVFVWKCFTCPSHQFTLQT